MVTAGALCGTESTKVNSPFARTPYNPHSRQIRIKFIISGDSDAASGFQILNMKQVLFLLMFFPPSPPERTYQSAAHLAVALSADAQWMEMSGFLRLAAGDHATGHHAWTPVQLFPIVLDSGAVLYSSHSAPDSGLPLRPLTHPRRVTAVPF